MSTRAAEIRGVVMHGIRAKLEGLAAARPPVRVEQAPGLVEVK